MVRASIARRLANTAWVARASVGERRVAWRPLAELERLQSLRARALVRHAFEQVPHYREAMRALGLAPGDVRTADDLRHLPPVDKLELTLHPGRFSPPGADARDGITLVSSGTSGLCRRFRHDRRSILEALAAGRRQRVALAHFVGREAGYREAVVNRPGSVATQIRDYIEARTLSVPGVELSRRILTPWMSFPDLRAELAAFRPEVVHGIGSHLGAFFRWMHASGFDDVRPRAITYGADAMPAHDRALIERDLGIPVVSTYQAVEALRIGFECEARRGFHVSIDQVAFRVVDGEGRDVAPGGRGALLLTNLVNRATVVVNYKLGDLVTLGDGPCPCGRTLPLIRGVDGRLDDLIARPDGSRIPAIVLVSQLQAIAGVRQVRVDQLDYDRFEVKLIPMTGAACDEGAIRAAFRERLGAGSSVAVELVDRLPSEPSGKTKTFATRVPAP